MKLSTMLRTLLILEWVMIIASVILSFAMESYLPAELRSWLQSESEQDLNPSDWLMFLVGVPLIMLTLIATVGLLLLRRWGAWLYLASTVLGIAFMPFTGPTVDHALADAVGEIASILAGVIIGIAFFSDVLKQEERITPPGS